MGKYDQSQLNKVYNMITESRKKYGHLKKCEFHIHTPASYDYHFIKDCEYEKLTIDDILRVSQERNFLTQEIIEEIKENIDQYSGEEYLEKLMEQSKPYDSFKDYLAYMNIAHKLYIEDIQVAVICDHNTIDGFKKLKYALNEYYLNRIKGLNNGKEIIYLFLGVEISCSDKNHLITICDDDKYDKLKDYLDNIILSKQEGTYLGSREIINDISTIGGISYLAHVNSSKLLGNRAYNMKLFTSKGLKAIGITQIEQKESQIQRLRNFNPDIQSKVAFILEGDSHEIDTLGMKSTWIKFNKVNFTSLENAFINFGVCIYEEKPNQSKKFIKGLVLYPGETGFLGTKNKNSKENFFMIEFSRDLNCIIGGRGTGKSTLLNIIETIHSFEIIDEKTLEFVSENKLIYSVFFLEGKDYILQFIPQTTNYVNDYYTHNIYLPKAIIEKNGIKYLSSNWINLYEVKNDDFIKIDEFETKRILQMLYSRSYNINQIVNQINNGQVGDFIKGIVAHGVDYGRVTKYIDDMKKVTNKSFIRLLRENVESIVQFIDIRKLEIHDKIKDFNLDYKDLIEIVYSPNEQQVDYYLLDILQAIKGNGHVLNTYLTWDDVQNFIIKVTIKIGFLEFLNLILNKRFKDIEKIYKISDFYDDKIIRFTDAEKRLNRIDNQNTNNIYNEIYYIITKNRESLENSIIKCFEVLDNFTLKFNINSKESVRSEKVIMRDIENLSLGQKVVAILTFVFNFGLTANDNTPLLIDQPEDNLDNQYIYKNLVNSLKMTKNNRQVIIATHNSTIVTNAHAEQIIVMESDNENGWVEKTGYPTDPIITKYIINNLEGGVDSFIHKVDNYSIVISSLIS